MAEPRTAARKPWHDRWVPFGWLRWKIGHHSARLCWWLYDRLRGVDELGNRLNKWAYK